MSQKNEEKQVEKKEEKKIEKIDFCKSLMSKSEASKMRADLAWKLSREKEAKGEILTDELFGQSIHEVTPKVREEKMKRQKEHDACERAKEKVNATIEGIKAKKEAKTTEEPKKEAKIEE